MEFSVDFVCLFLWFVQVKALFSPDTKFKWFIPDSVPFEHFVFVFFLVNFEILYSLIHI